MTKKSRRKFKYLENEKSFQDEIINFFFNFQGDSVSKNCFRSETASLTILAIKRGLLCNFATTLKDRHFMEHSGTGLQFLITIDL